LAHDPTRFKEEEANALKTKSTNFENMEIRGACSKKLEADVIS
jgi:hypothetical protein